MTQPNNSHKEIPALSSHTDLLVSQIVKRYFALILFLLILTLVNPAKADEHSGLNDLWIDLSIGTPLIDLFNARAEEDDIARVEHISQLDLLSDIRVGKKLVVFKSAADAIRLLPHIHQEIDIVGYNLEHGPANPIFEQENPMESIQRLREEIDRYDLELALGPDRRFAESDGVAMAPYADYFILQVQKVQTDPDTVYAFVEPLISDIRTANPDIQISLQIRTEGDTDALLELLAPLNDEIQGISILTSEDTLDVAESLVSTLRPDERAAEPEYVELPVAAPVNTPAPRANTDRGEQPAEEAAQDEAQVTAAVQVRIQDSPTARPTEALTLAEENERNGSTALFVIIALVAGFALGAGYVSHRTGS